MGNSFSGNGLYTKMKMDATKRCGQSISIIIEEGGGGRRKGKEDGWLMQAFSSGDGRICRVRERLLDLV